MLIFTVEKSGTAPTSNSGTLPNTNPDPQKDIGLSDLTNGTDVAELDEVKNVHNEQRGLFEFLKPIMTRLCEALLLKVCIK